MKCNNEYQIGDKVFLLEQTSWNTLAVMNPLNVVGEIVDEDGDWVYVDWSNTDKGLTNAYKRFDFDFKPVE